MPCEAAGSRSVNGVTLLAAINLQAERMSAAPTPSQSSAILKRGGEIAGSIENEDKF